MKEIYQLAFFFLITINFATSSWASVVYISSPTAINPDTVSRSVPNGVIYNPNVIVNPFKLQTVNPYGTPQNSPIVSNNDSDDYRIASNVQSQIALSGSFAGSSITVICQEGIVTLLGTVTQLSKASLAIKIAGSVPGVKGVNSRLSIYYGTGYQ